MAINEINPRINTNPTEGVPPVARVEPVQSSPDSAQHQQLSNLPEVLQQKIANWDTLTQQEQEGVIAELKGLRLEQHAGLFFDISV